MRSFKKHSQTCNQTQSDRIGAPDQGRAVRKGTASQFIQLQRTIGNQAIRRLWQPDPETMESDAATESADPPVRASGAMGSHGSIQMTGVTRLPYAKALVDRRDALLGADRFVPRAAIGGHKSYPRRISAIMRQLPRRYGPPAREKVDKYAGLAKKFYFWLHSASASMYEIKIVGLLTSLSKSEVSRVERAYGQPKGEKGEWNPYLLRDEIAKSLPNGERIARWIRKNSELKPRPTEEEAKKFMESDTKKKAAKLWPEEGRKKSLLKLGTPGKWPKRVQGYAGDIVLNEKTTKEVALWGPWVIAHFDYLYGQNVVTDQMTSLLQYPHGDLALIWMVRTQIWNRWVRLNRESAVPTAFVPNMLPMERRGRIKAAQVVIPKMESFRKLFDKTPGPLADYMKKMINARVDQLRQIIQVYQR